MTLLQRLQQFYQTMTDKPPITPDACDHLVATHRPDTVAPHIRWGIHRDLPQIMLIHILCAEQLRLQACESALPLCYTQDDIQALLRNRNMILLVAEMHDDVVGFMIYELNPRALDLILINVAPELQRMGIGSAMLNYLKSKLTHERRSRLRCIVSEWQTGMHLFLAKHHFLAGRPQTDCWPSDPEHVGYPFTYDV